MTFFQAKPSLTNLCEQDIALKSELNRRLPKELLAKYKPQFISMGDVAANDLQQWVQQAEGAPPKHIPYDPWRSNSLGPLSDYFQLAKILGQNWRLEYL